MRKTASTVVLDQRSVQPSSPFMTLLLTEEADCHIFKFWQDGRINTGLRHKENLFAHYQTFQRRQHQQVHRLAVLFAQHAIRAIVTCSPDHYTLWISLRSDWWTMGDDRQRKIVGFLGASFSHRL